MATNSCSDLNEAIQIITPVDHSFVVELNNLQKVFDNEGIENRHAVIVSIAGAFRQGKSFLLNFFLRYLNARYKKYDVTDWLDENENSSKLNGFKWRGGRKPETIGIWMWSEIFTHDYDNGDRVAIILLDTQGIFDNKSSVRDCTTIFVLSTMLSSVQCYNLMHNIREDDLQHLELFTEYGRLVLEQSNEKPFQSLIFIVRDWPFAYETDYGWDKTVTDEILSINDEQTLEMRQLRDRIKSSFEDIRTFLMPHPGFVVTQGNNFTGDLHQIEADFKKYIKELVPSIFAPENLIVKKISGQKLRVQNVLTYLQTYVSIFNGYTLPEPKTILMATAEASNQVLYTEALNFYLDSMNKLLRMMESFYDETELKEHHDKVKNDAIAQFLAKPTLGGNVLQSNFQRKIENAINEKFKSFAEENALKRSQFIEKANLHNNRLRGEINQSVKTNLSKAIGNSSSISMNDLNVTFVKLKNDALNEFDDRKMGDAEMSKSIIESLQQHLSDIQCELIKLSETYNGHLEKYSEAMWQLLDQKDYYEKHQLVELHQYQRNIAVDQFQQSFQGACSELFDLRFIFQHNLVKNVDERFPSFEQKNGIKYQGFVDKANSHNGIICGEIRSSFECRVRNAIGRSYRSDGDFIDLFRNSKQQSLQEFADRKMGGVDISSSFRETLERDLDNLEGGLKHLNNMNKPPEPRRRRKWYKL